jgi:ABC-type dipeptide/oligopeptide/nickel transport system ATPase component
VVRVLCDRVMVLRGGTVVETGSCTDLFAAPKHPYTQELLKAVPLPEVDPNWLDREDSPQPNLTVVGARDYP